MVTKLTDAQIARIPEWRDGWIRAGLSTEPADFDAAEAAVRSTLELIGDAPAVVLRMGSPFATTLGGIMIQPDTANVRDQVWAQVGAQVRDQVWAQVVDQVRAQVWAQVRAQVVDQVVDQVRDQVRDQVWAQVGAQVRDQVWAQVWAQVGAQVRAQVGAQVRAQVWAQVVDQVRDQVWAQVGAQVRAQVVDQVRAQVVDQVWAQVEAQVWAQVGAELGGQYLSQWHSFVAYFSDVVGIVALDTPQVRALRDLTTTCGWIWWGNGVVAISDRPSVIHLDDRGRLHCENGRAIEYRDGWGLYRWHGVEVPEHVIMAPETITVQAIDAEQNAEVRRVMVERYGEGRYLEDAGAVEVSSYAGGTLLRRDMEDDEPIVMVRVVNSTQEPDGSRKTYYLRVPPDMTDAREAVAWTFGLTPDTYAPLYET